MSHQVKEYIYIHIKDIPGLCIPPVLLKKGGFSIRLSQPLSRLALLFQVHPVFGGCVFFGVNFG